MDRQDPTPACATEACGDYEAALAWLLRAEQGFADDARDRGGPTKYGITIASWRDYTGRQDLTREDVAAISLDDAHAFYMDVYWRPLHLGELSLRRPMAARAIFDMAVLHGAPRVVRLVQRIAGVPEDGIMGPKTRAMVAALPECPFLLHFCCLMTERFASIVSHDATQLVFLRNWVWRSTRLLGLVEI